MIRFDDLIRFDCAVRQDVTRVVRDGRAPFTSPAHAGGMDHFGQPWDATSVAARLIGTFETDGAAQVWVLNAVDGSARVILDVPSDEREQVSTHLLAIAEAASSAALISAAGTPENVHLARRVLETSHLELYRTPHHGTHCAVMSLVAVCTLPTVDRVAVRGVSDRACDGITVSTTVTVHDSRGQHIATATFEWTITEREVRPPAAHSRIAGAWAFTPA